jgi:hypothetical protein
MFFIYTCKLIPKWKEEQKVEHSLSSGFILVILPTQVAMLASFPGYWKNEKGRNRG